MLKIIDRCQLCSNKDLIQVLSMGHMPAVNKMRPCEEEDLGHWMFPADLLFCDLCGLAQLKQILDPNLAFPQDYPYRSGTTKSLCENFKDLYLQAAPYLKAGDLVIDIGSNDGTLLRNFQQFGYRVMGIEPTKMADVAMAAGIPTIHSFFSPQIAKLIQEVHGKAKVITACNVFAHMDNIHEVIESVKLMMDQNGVFVVENHDLEALVNLLQIDCVYHEHLRFYSLHSLTNLFNMHDMVITETQKIPTHGGSLRCYVRK